MLNAKPYIFPYFIYTIHQFIIFISNFVDSMEKDDLSLTVKTPWGALVTSKGAQILFERFADDVLLLEKKIERIEGKESKDTILSQLKENNENQVKNQIEELENRLDLIDKRISELDTRFTQFSKQSLKLLNDLTTKMEKIDKS